MNGWDDIAWDIAFWDSVSSIDVAWETLIDDLHDRYIDNAIYVQTVIDLTEWDRYDG